MVHKLTDCDSCSGKEEWKQSWRAMSGNKSRGRVKGMAFALESVEDNSPANSPERIRLKNHGACVHTRAQVNNPRVFDQFVDPVRPQLRRRADSELSTTSTASVDSGKGSQQSDEPTSSWMMTSPDLSRADIGAGELSAEVYRAKQATNGGGTGHGSRTGTVRAGATREGTPERAQRPKMKSQNTVMRGPGAKLVTKKLERWSAVDGLPEDGDEAETVTRRTSGRSVSGKSQLADLFDLDLPHHDAMPIPTTLSPNLTKNLGGDIMRLEVGDGKGSMVLVKSRSRSVLAIGKN